MSAERPTEAETEDWAARLAMEIALDMQNFRCRDALLLTARRLRIVKMEGRLDGFKEGSDNAITTINRAFDTVAGGRDGSEGT